MARSWHSRGNLGTGPRSFDYVMDGPEWVEPTLLGAGVALVLAALLLWAARSTVFAVLGCALLVVAVAAGVTAVVTRSNAGTATRAELRGAGDLPTEDAVRARLGPPAGHATMTGGGAAASCLVYWRSPSRHDMQDFFCFRAGRLVHWEHW